MADEGHHDENVNIGDMRPFLDGKLNITQMIEERKRQIHEKRTNFRQASHSSVTSVEGEVLVSKLKASNIRIHENYETIVVEKSQIGELRQMESFAKQILTLQKQVGERGIELVEATKARKELEIEVNSIQARIQNTTKILNQLLSIHNKLKPQETGPAFTVGAMDVARLRRRMQDYKPVQVDLSIENVDQVDLEYLGNSAI